MPNFREFAWLCKAVYDRTATVCYAGFARMAPMELRISGFQGAIYRRPTGTGFEWIVAVAGTQPTDGLGVDVVADAGFGGPLGNIVSPVLSAAGQLLLEDQCRCAAGLVRNARSQMRASDRLYIAGHSLGGGIAQIVAAREGVAAVGISAPAVTAVAGVEHAWRRTRPPITCLRVRNDPINHTGRIASWLGRVVFLPTSRTGGDAHSIDRTFAELEPAGSFSSIGESDPFTA